jgi:hypothetical protein
MDVVLLMGLAALGYAMANETAPRKKKQGMVSAEGKSPMETFVNPEQTGGVMQVIDAFTGHNNMVPFFARMTQSVYSGATDGILDTYTGTGRHTFHHKEEAPAFFVPEKGTGNPFGQQSETDFEQSRQVTSCARPNVFPIDRVQVGPGVTMDTELALRWIPAGCGPRVCPATDHR